MKTSGFFIHQIFRLFILSIAAAVLAFPVLKGQWVTALPLGLVVCILGCAYAIMHLARKGLPSLPVAGTRSAWFIASLIVFTLIIQLSLILMIRPAPRFDGLFVVEQAREFLVTGHMPPLTYYAPGQIWWYAGFFSIFGDGALVAQLSHLPLAGLAVWVFYRLARIVLPLKRAQFTTTLFALYPAWLAYVLVTPYYFYLYTLLLLLMVYFLTLQQRCIRDLTHYASLAPAFLAGIAAGATALTKAVALIASAQLAAALVFTRARRGLTVLIVFTLAMTAALAPWMWRNYKVFDAWVPVCTSGGLVMLSANHPDSDGLYSPMPDQPGIDTPKAMLEHSRTCQREAMAIIKAQPLFFIQRALKKFVFTWGNEATYSELINRRGRRVPILDHAIAGLSQTAWILLVLMCLGAVFRKGGRLDDESEALRCLLEIIILSNAAVYLVYEGGARHHLPMAPLLMLWAALHLKPLSLTKGALKFEIRISKSETNLNV